MWLVMGLIGNLIRVKHRAFASQNEQIAIDPVCGMNIEIGGQLKQNIMERFIIFATPTANRHLRLSQKNIWRLTVSINRSFFLDKSLFML